MKNIHPRSTASASSLAYNILPQEFSTLFRRLASYKIDKMKLYDINEQLIVKL